jgi:hypothetical protein
MLLSKALKMQ